MRDIWVDVGDAHSVNKHGVHPPLLHLPEAGDHKATPVECWLWDRWLALRDYALSFRRPGDRLHVVFNGDLGDSAWKHRTHNLISYNFAEAIQIAQATVAPWLEVADDWFVTAGTEAHAGVGGELEQAIANAIAAQPLPADPECRVWDLLRVECQGLRLDFAHHGKIGGRDWTITNQLAGMYMDCLSFYAAQELKIPKLGVYSHVHKAQDSANSFPIRILTTPGWLLKAYYQGRQPYRRSDLGGTLVVVEDGRLAHVENVVSTPNGGQVAIWQCK